MSRKLSLRQKTCWSFKRKVMKAMESSGKYPLEGHVDVDEFFVGDFEHLQQIPAGEKGGNFPEIHRAIMLFKAWLRVIYHSVRDLRAYIDKYTYRFNRHLMNASIFDNLIVRMVKAKLYYLYN